MSDYTDELRAKALSSLRLRLPILEEISELSPWDVQELVRKLELYHVELEVQNNVLRSTQEHLEELKDKYRDLYDRAPVGYLTLNTDGVVTEANRTLAELVGTEPVRIVGQRIEVIAAPESRGECRRHFERLRDGADTDVCDLDLIHRDGSRRPVMLRTARIDDRSRGTSTFRSVVSDISHRTDVENEWRARLEEREMEMETKIREVHHRAKNNLTMVDSLLSLHTRDEETSEVLAAARERIRAVTTLHSLLYRSPDLKSLTMDAYLGTILDELAASQSVVGLPVMVERDIDPISPNHGIAVPVGLILTELVTNCFKHAFQGRDHGRIRVSLKNVADEEYELVVEDDGIGMSDSPAGEEPKTLGLQLIAAFTEQLNGNVTTARSPGTRVTVRFKAGS